MSVSTLLNKIAFGILIIVLMAISNPKSKEHRSVVKDAIMTDVVSNVKTPDGIGEGIGLGLGLVVGAGAVDLLVDLAYYRNFIIFSTLSNAKEGNGDLLSIGIFGNVIPLVNEEMKR